MKMRIWSGGESSLFVEQVSCSVTSVDYIVDLLTRRLTLQPGPMSTDRSSNLREVASEPSKGSTCFGQLLPLLDEYLLADPRSQGYRIWQALGKCCGSFDPALEYDILVTNDAA